MGTAMGAARVIRYGGQTAQSRSRKRDHNPSFLLLHPELIWFITHESAQTGAGIVPIDGLFDIIRTNGLRPMHYPQDCKNHGPLIGPWIVQYRTSGNHAALWSWANVG